MFSVPNNFLYSMPNQFPARPPAAGSSSFDPPLASQDRVPYPAGPQLERLPVCPPPPVPPPPWRSAHIQLELYQICAQSLASYSSLWPSDLSYVDPQPNFPPPPPPPPQDTAWPPAPFLHSSFPATLPPQDHTVPAAAPAAATSSAARRDLPPLVSSSSATDFGDDGGDEEDDMMQGQRPEEEEEEEEEEEDGDMLKLDVGFRFDPHDRELILSYLLNKTLSRPLPCELVHDVGNLYDYDAHELPRYSSEACRRYAVKEKSYFFSTWKIKYPKGRRPSRSTPNGYWKATGKDKEITDPRGSGGVVGYRKSLVFYLGKPSKGKPSRGSKTQWTMKEYRINGSLPELQEHGDPQVNKYVLCEIHHMNERKNK